MNRAHHALSVLLALAFSGVLVLTVSLQKGQAAETPAGTCGKNTMTFGCSAYILANTNSAPSYAGRADTVVVDAQELSKNPGLAQRLNQNGPFPILYTNSFCESRFGACPGPYLRSSDVSNSYNERIQDPNSGSFYQNFQTQLGWVKQVQGRVIEIDNMDEYIRQGHKNAIIKLIQLAANSGVNVVSKNVKDADILRQPNVVGAIVEEGSGNAAEYHAAFQAAGKPCAGVLMVNARSTAGNQYTSHSQCDHPSRGGKSEYTKCTCTKNPAGMQIAGTPVAGPNVDIPPAALQQAYNSPPQSNPFAQQSQQPTGVTSGQQPSQSGGVPQQISQPFQQQPQFAQLPQSNLNQQPTAVKDKTETAEEKKTNALLKTSKEKAESEESREGEETDFYNPLSGTQKKGSTTPPRSNDKLIPKPFGDARMRCLPNSIFRGAKPTIAWSCGKKATSSTGIGFETKNFLLGSGRVVPTRTTLYAVKCYEEGVLIGSAQCVIQVRSDKSAEESFGASTPGAQPEQRKKSLCFLSFCL